MASYSLIDVFLLLGIAQGFFLGITLSIVHQKNRAANKVLALQLLLACFCLLTRMLIHKADELWIIQRLAPLESLIFIFGPLGYIYLRRLLEKDQKQFRVSWFHYLPAMVYLVLLLSINLYSEEEFRKQLIAGHYVNVFFIAECSALIFNGYYWYLNAYFFSTVLRKEKEQLSFTQSVIPFVRVVLIASGSILLAWAISFFSANVFQVTIPIINYDLVWIAIPLLIYIVGYFALKQPEIFRVYLITDKPKTKVRELMNKRRSEELQQQLTKLMREEKVYLNNELTLAELSRQLNTSTNNLSWLLNTIYKSSFYDFINGYRVREFIAKLDQNEHKSKTLLALSLEVGFNSKTTFYKAFRSILNETPSSYIKKTAS
ncbi:AraC family transcriptional regulator [uncultured Croceitalea sp.]|uniref:helix-turn-helix domain-containing protein n=1 Tax=uncultured Croceitalea sp. TaxID=1798908 RepID=UPI003305EE7F